MAVAEATPTAHYLQHGCSARTVQVIRRYKSSSGEVCPCHDEGSGRPEGMRGMVHLALGTAAFDASGERGGIDANTFMPERSTTRPSSQVPRPGPLRPPPRTANVSTCSRAKLTAAITSATSLPRAIRAGCFLISRCILEEPAHTQRRQNGAAHHASVRRDLESPFPPKRWWGVVVP
jgi:hypothetical protein